MTKFRSGNGAVRRGLQGGDASTFSTFWGRKRVDCTVLSRLVRVSTLAGTGTGNRVQTDQPPTAKMRQSVRGWSPALGNSSPSRFGTFPAALMPDSISSLDHENQVPATGLSGVISPLRMRIGAMNLAGEVSNIAPAKVAFGTVNARGTFPPLCYYLFQIHTDPGLNG